MPPTTLKSRLRFIFGCTAAAAMVFFAGIISNVYADVPDPISAKLNNPIGVDSIVDLLEALLAIVVVLATPVIVFFIIYSGFLYVTAQGNAAKVEEATKSLTYAVIGGVLVLGAFAIAQIVKSLVDSFL